MDTYRPAQERLSDMPMTAQHTPNGPEGDRRPCILICNWDPANPAWDLVEDLSGVPWHPDQARSELVAGNTDVVALASDLVSRLQHREARALLLLGPTRYDGPIRLQIRAEIPKDDGERLDNESPGVVRATAPCADIIHAVSGTKVAIIPTSEAEDDAGSKLLYHIMTGLGDDAETLAVALMRFPRSASEASVSAAIKAAATVMTQHLAPLPRVAGFTRL